MSGTAVLNFKRVKIHKKKLAKSSLAKIPENARRNRGHPEAGFPREAAGFAGGSVSRREVANGTICLESSLQVIAVPSGIVYCSSLLGASRI
jgi:hypothetical protein